MAKAPAKNKAKSSAAKKKSAPKKVAKAKPAPKKAAAAKKAPSKGAKKGAAKKPAPVKVKKRLVQVKRKTVEVVNRLPVPKAIVEATNRALAQAEVEGLLRRLPPPVQPVVKTLRRLMLDAAPEATERLEDGAPAYFANGVFARIEPKEREVLVKFMHGGQLPSAAGLPGEGDSRVVSLASLEELKESVLRKLVREAVMLNLSPPPPAARA
jgi:hypothetical protein